jgi:integrase
LNQDGEPLNFHTWRGGIWYRILRGAGVKERKPYSTRHTFISIGLSNNVNPKWIAEYCGTSVAMIDKHYGKYVRNDSEEQLAKLAGTVTPIRDPRRSSWPSS